MKQRQNMYLKEEIMQDAAPDTNNMTQTSKKSTRAKRGCLIGLALCVIINVLYLIIVILPEYGVKWFVPQNYMTSDMGRNFALGFFPLVFLFSLAVGSLLSLLIWFSTWRKSTVS